MANRDTIVALLKKQLYKEPLSPAEASTLQKWAAKSPANGEVVERWTHPEQIQQTLDDLPALDRVRSWELIASRLAPSRKYRASMRTFGVLAASMLVVIAVSIFYTFRPSVVSTHYPVTTSSVPSAKPVSTDNFAFQNTTLPTAMHEIGQWYGVLFSVDPALANLHISAEFRRSRPLREILAILEASGQFRVTHQQSHYVLTCIKEQTL